MKIQSTKMFKAGFVNSLAVLAYIALVAMLMQNGDIIFGKLTNVLGPIVFLLLFVVSALVVGGLILGKPFMLYLDEKKKEALSLFFCTALSLAIYMILILLIAIVIT
jgi:hypothetical protein